MRADEKPSCECWLTKVSSRPTLRCIQMQGTQMCLLEVSNPQTHRTHLKEVLSAQFSEPEEPSRGVLMGT